jgi:hypothetical protein
MPRQPLRILLVLALLWQGWPARATDPVPGPPPGPVDDSPTGFACTVDTLLSGRKCSLEFAPSESADSRQQADQNVAQAQAAGSRLCERVTHIRDESSSDPDLRQYCQKAYEIAASAQCSLGGAHALLDAAGRFATDSGPCYRAMAAVLSHVRTAAALSARCCRCAAAACSMAYGQCNESILRSSLKEEFVACARSRCEAQCETSPGISKATSRPEESSLEVFPIDPAIDPYFPYFLPPPPPPAPPPNAAPTPAPKTKVVQPWY